MERGGDGSSMGQRAKQHGCKGFEKAGVLAAWPEKEGERRVASEVKLKPRGTTHDGKPPAIVHTVGKATRHGVTVRSKTP